MAGARSVQDLNRELAQRINEEARKDPSSPYANKLVGIANGQVVVVTNDWDDLARRLRQIEPDATRTFCLEASENNEQVEEVWGLR